MSTYNWDQMNTYKWEQAASPRCVYADTFYRTARDAVFKRLSENTTPKQFQAAQESLLLLRQELEQGMPAMHFSSPIGTHLCVKDLCREAIARLRSLALLQPEPSPPPPPEPPEEQPPLTHEDVENLFRKLPPETFFGQERDEESE